MLSNYSHILELSQSQQREMGTYLFWKERGETLAMLLVRFRKEHNIALGIKITYAGRLDPMASGVVLLLVGDARFEKESYLKLSKIYEVDIVFGLTTDSLDPLGIVSVSTNNVLDFEKVREVLSDIPETLDLPYPRFSSPLVEGKPLFVHAKAGTTVVIPTRTARIYASAFLGHQLLSANHLSKDAIETIGKVEGDFRQEECIRSWKNVAEKYIDTPFLVCTMSFTVSSGTYIRSIAKWFGEQLGIDAYAHHIRRIGYLEKE